MKKSEFRFGLSVETNDLTGEVIAVYFQLRAGKVAATKECKEGVAFADYDRDGKLLGVELLGPCEIEVLDKIAKQKPARDFLRRSVPQGMLLSA
jgi:hypothetical protein